MVFLLKSFLSGAGDGISWANYAVVDLDADDLRQLAARRQAFQAAKAADDSLLEMWYWNSAACFYGYEVEIPEVEGDGGEYLDELLKADDSRVLNADECSKLEALDPDRTDCPQVVVRETGVCWYALDKYSDVTTLTAEVSWADLGLESPLNAEQRAAIRAMAIDETVNDAGGDRGFLQGLAERYVDALPLDEQLCRISDDPECQAEMLGFDPATGAAVEGDDRAVSS